MPSLLVKSVVRGYHVYPVVWEPQIHEKIYAVHKPGNVHDRHAMAVYRKDEPGNIVGHLPREIAKTCYFFNKHDGKITGEVTGCRVHSEEAGGLEVPCRLKFTGRSRNIRKLKKVFEQLHLPTVTVIQLSDS